MTAEAALKEFLGAWDVQERDSIVSKAEFFDYYDDVSGGIDRDDYFELMMRNAWHISGGEGWAANTSCRRVLVIHSDATQVCGRGVCACAPVACVCVGGGGAGGSAALRRGCWHIRCPTAQEVVEITDDLGFRATDIPAIKARLRQQGVKDIHTVKLAE